MKYKDETGSQPMHASKPWKPKAPRVHDATETYTPPSRGSMHRIDKLDGHKGYSNNNQFPDKGWR